MKKLFTFLFAALMSAGMWADPNIVTPTISGDLSFIESTTVTMECTSPNSDIYYTTDGVTDPRCDCAAAPEYKQPITITETTIIKAAAFDGDDWSAVAEVTFTKVPAPTTYTLELYVNDSTMGSIELVNALKHTGPLEGYEGKLVYKVTEGDTVIIRAFAKEGFAFKTWMYANNMDSINWVSEENCYYCGLEADEAELSFVMKEDIAIMAEFAEAIKKYMLELYVNDTTMGSIELVNALKHTGPLDNAEGKLVYEVVEGDSVIIRATANEGYDFKNWKYANDLKNLNWVSEENCYYCGLAADEAELSFEMKEDIAIMAVFEEAQGIENVVLTESAQKVTVDGVLYIVRDGKMYNAQGAQVR